MRLIILLGLCLTVYCNEETDPTAEDPQATENADEPKKEGVAEEKPKEPEPPRRPKILVLYEKESLRWTHSVWLSNIGRVGQVVLKSAADPNLKLDKYDANLYHSVFVMAPSVEHFGGNVTEETFVDFVNRGGNLFVTADSTIGTAVQELANQFGVEYDEPGKKVICHIQEDNTMDDGHHTSFALKAEFAYAGDLLSVYGDNRYYSMPWTNAIGLYVPPEHESALQLVKANENCYTGNTDDLQFFTPGKYDSKFKGRNIALIAILQAEKSRVLFAGSMDTFSNDLIYRQNVKYFRSSSITDQDPEAETRENYIESMNSTPKLIMHALGWMMGMKNQFKVTMFRHYKLDDISQTEKFYVNDTVRFEMRISESVDGTWLPLLHTDAFFMAEFNRIDTFIRAPLQTKGDGRYYVDMRLPDVYGVYTFRTFITKPGYNLIQIDQKVTVNPTPYDHYPRFLECAYPYYLSAFSMMTGVFSLSFVFLYHKETAKVTQTKKDK